MSKPPITKAVRDRITLATKLVAQGLKYREVAEKLGVKIYSVIWWRRAHRDVWDASLREAVAVVQGKREQGISAYSPVVEVPGGTGMSMLLSDFVNTLYLPSRVEVSEGYAEVLNICVRKFSAHLGRDAKLSDLTEQAICDYLSAYRKKWSARSTNNQRTTLVTFALAAWDYGLLPAAPRTRRIRKLKTNTDPPVAWTVEQVGQLFAHVGQLKGDVAGIRAGFWWGALFRTIYWSGCRIGAMLQAESSCYSRGEGVLIRNQKNKTPQWYTLPASCCEAIDATKPWNRKLIFPYKKCRHTIFVEARRIIETAGLPCPRSKGMGLFHRMRRTNISYCAAADPAIAQRQAGHSSYATTLKHYIDPRIARGRTAADVLPEPLTSQGPDAA